MAGRGLAVGDPVELSVRPESVELRPSNGTTHSPTPIAASVEHVAYLGSSVQYIVRTTGGLSITALTHKTEERLAVGRAIDVTWSPAEALVLAAPPTEQRQEEIRA